MRIRLRFFAQLRERLGTGADRDVETGSSVGGVWEAVVGGDPVLRAVPVRFAVNERYVEPTHRLRDGDELAVFPPVSGGAGA